MDEISIASPDIRTSEYEAVAEVLESGQLAEGETVRRFESEFADYCGTDHAVATANGTTALHTALEAVGIEPGSTVVTTPFSFVASANAIRFAGGIPVFADIDPDTYLLDPDSVEARIQELDGKVDAVLVVHLYGLPADMTRFRELADKYDLALVEDAAQAHGATYEGRPVGSFGDAAAFSYYPTKNMTTGEGGMVTTNRADVERSARRFVNHGREPEAGGYDHAVLGHNYRMTNVAAAIGREQLERLPEFVSARRENARRLTERLAETPVVTPTVPSERRHAYNQYTVRSETRDELQEHLEGAGVGTATYYPTPIHELEVYAEFSVERPVAERAADEVLSLPVHPAVTEADVDHIADAIIQEVGIDA